MRPARIRPSNELGDSTLVRRADAVYMRRYLQATKTYRVWLDDKLAPHRELYHQRILEAEAAFKAHMERPYQFPRYPNTNYWDKWGPAINGYVMDCRRVAAEAALEKAETAAVLEYEANTAEIHAIYKSRVKGAIASKAAYANHSSR